MRDFALPCFFLCLDIARHRSKILKPKRVQISGKAHVRKFHFRFLNRHPKTAIMSYRHNYPYQPVSMRRKTNKYARIARMYHNEALQWQKLLNDEARKRLGKKWDYSFQKEHFYASKYNRAMDNYDAARALI